jgi:RNA polymerase sigma-70 factor (ECF subfamily)
MTTTSRGGGHDGPDLVARARRGDRDAIGALLARWHGELRAYVARRAGREVLARESGMDIVQSACREVLHALPGAAIADGEAGLKAWLFQATLRKIVDRNRYWARARRDVRLDAGAQALSDDCLRAIGAALSSPSAAAARQEDLARLSAAIDRLPAAHREVLVMVYFERLPQAEVAQRLGRSADSVRGLVARAVARLARLVLGG